jgi:hypothetical protein
MIKTRWLRSGLLVLLGLAVLFMAAIAAFNFEVCRECGFICKNTGSQRGYREWCLGWKTGQWYKASALERFMEVKYPHELQHKWVSYEGTGKNIFGMTILWGHGRPGPIILLDHEILAAYIQESDDFQKKALYDLFSSGDEPAIEAKIEQMPLELQKRE